MANERRRDRDDDFDDDRRVRRRPRDEFDERDDYADGPGGARRGPVGKGVNVCGVIALILGIIGGLISLFPCIGVFVGGPIAIIGLLLGIIGLFTSGKATGRGLPIAGTCVSVIALLIGGGQLLFLGYLGKRGEERMEVLQKEMEAQAKANQEQARLMQEENERKERELRDGPAVSVTAEKLFEDYDKNPLDADKKYKNKVLEVTGVVLRNDADAFGRTTIELDSTGDGIIHCEFPREAKNQTDKVKPKNKVVIRGRCAGVSGKDKIKLESCLVVSRGKS
jgi:hypothetical protein